MDSFNGGGRTGAPRNCFWLVVPVLTGQIVGHLPGALEAHESYTLCFLASPLVATTPLLPQSLLEPVLRGREVMVGHLWRRPWGMTHIRRRTQGHLSHLVTHSPPKAPTDRGPRGTQGYTRGQLCHSGSRRPSSAQASAGTSSGLVNRWGGWPGERLEPLGRAGHTPPPPCLTAQLLPPITRGVVFPRG